MSLGLGAGSAGHSLGQKGGAAPHSEPSPPLSAMPTAEPKAALQCPGAAKLLGPEPGSGLQLLRLQES